MPEPGTSGAPTTVSFEPSASAGEVPNVVHLHVASANLAPGSVSLFQGTLSSYYLGKLKRGELPDALISRRVPVVSFVSSGELVVAPLRPLETDDHSLVGSEGLLAEFRVAAAAPLLERVWPTATGAGGIGFAVYCAAEGSALPVAAAAQFSPRALEVAFESGADEQGSFADRCLHFAASVQLEPNEVLVPPPRLGDFALSPAIFSGAEQTAATSVPCGASATAIALGCAEVADDQLSLRTPTEPVLWVLHTARGSLLEVSRAGSTIVLRGLSPETQERIWGAAYDALDAHPFDLTVTTAPARARLVLNEALADALGPEPQSEWVEIFNDGTLGVDLAQFRFQDGGGRIALPSAWLAPKSFALLVREDFEPTGSDEPPLPGTLLVRVPSLGKSGLANSGERLALIDPLGQECSVLPAASGKAGQSLSRRTPSTRDDDPDGFAFAVPTPGFANVVK